MLIQAKRRSKVKSNLCLEDLLPLPTHCPILGIELSYTPNIPGKREGNKASLDQIIPGKGYVRGNVVIISSRANRLKDNGSALEHRLISDFMTQYEENHHERITTNPSKEP